MLGLCHEPGAAPHPQGRWQVCDKHSLQALGDQLALQQPPLQPGKPGSGQGQEGGG